MQPTRKILVIDDNRDIHEDFRKVFESVQVRDAELDALEADLFGEAVAAEPDDLWLDVSVDSAFQGEEGVRMAIEAARAGEPYYMAFVDVRMPPGIDGIQTISKLWKHLPELPCVICTAFSDYGWKEMTRALGRSGQLLILKKPFDTVEVLQVAQALAERAQLASAAKSYQQQLEEQVQHLKRAETELKRNNEELLAARIDAESASRTKSEFLANMSHELRTPLNGVIGMTALLLDTTLSQQQKRYAHTIRSSAETLLELLNDILDFSKVEAGKLELERTNFFLGDVIEAAAEMVAHRCREKRLELNCFIDPAIPPELTGDPGRLRQILTNLATNAVKFTEVGEISIRAELVAEATEQATIRLSVRDTGIGIPSDRLGRLFNAFTQVDASTTRRFGGTGLGLAISKQLCELMGGQIDVESELGKGSLFWFSVTLPKASSTGSAATPPRERIGSGRVLIIDDHAGTRQMLVEQCTAWRFTADAVSTVESARSVLEKASADGTPFDTVLVDVELADLDIHRFAADVRMIDDCKDVRIVLLVPIGAEIDAAELQRAGIVRYVTKPIMQSDLYNALLPGGSTMRRAMAISAGSRLHHIPKTRHQNARILIAEDNQINREVAMEVLTRAGYACDIVGDGRAAVEAISQQRYDLVLMDCQMPEMDGFEATQRIRDAEAKGGSERRLPVLALTASALKGDRERCLEAGMSGYLSKPLNPVELIESVDTLLRDAMKCESASAASGPISSPSAPTQSVVDRPAESDSSPPSSSLIDADDLLRRCMGHRELADKLREEFRQQLEQDIEHLLECFQKGQTEDAYRRAHGLKGAAATVACKRVRDSAERLERAAKEGDLATADSQLRDLEECCRRLFEEWQPAGC